MARTDFLNKGAMFIKLSRVFPRLRLFEGLRLLILEKILKATFIWGATTIWEVRVQVKQFSASKATNANHLLDEILCLTII